MFYGRKRGKRINQPGKFAGKGPAWAISLIGVVFPNAGLLATVAVVFVAAVVGVTYSYLEYRKEKK
jgi:hypothetical protein